MRKSSLSFLFILITLILRSNATLTGVSISNKRRETPSTERTEDDNKTAEKNSYSGKLVVWHFYLTGRLGYSLLVEFRNEFF